MQSSRCTNAEIFLPRRGKNLIFLALYAERYVYWKRASATLPVTSPLRGAEKA